MLIPEAATLLIQDDLKCTQEYAMEVKAFSTSFGMMTFLANNDLDFRQLQDLIRNLKVITEIWSGNSEGVSNKFNEDREPFQTACPSCMYPL